MREVYEFLKKAEVYYIATVEGVQPRVRPFGTVEIFEDKLYIQTGKVKNVAKQIAENNKIEISAMADGAWIRITAEAVLDDRIEPQAHMLDTYPNLKDRYTAGDGNTAVYYLKNAVATIASFASGEKVIKF